MPLQKHNARTHFTVSCTSLGRLLTQTEVDFMNRPADAFFLVMRDEHLRHPGLVAPIL